jgi:hypothetical protein
MGRRREEGRRRWLSIWSRADEALAEEHWERLLSGTRDGLVELLAGESAPDGVGPDGPASPPVEEGSAPERVDPGA